MCFFFFKQKTAYEMRISDWSSDVCSSDLLPVDLDQQALPAGHSVIGEAIAALFEELLGRGRHHRVDRHVTPQAGADLDRRSVEIGFRQIGRASCRERVCQYV